MDWISFLKRLFFSYSNSDVPSWSCLTAGHQRHQSKATHWKEFNKQTYFLVLNLQFFYTARSIITKLLKLPFVCQIHEVACSYIKPLALFKGKNIPRTQLCYKLMNAVTTSIFIGWYSFKRDTFKYIIYNEIHNRRNGNSFATTYFIWLIEYSAAIFQLHTTYCCKSRGSAVGTDYRLDVWEIGVRVPVASRIFLSPYRPVRLWGPPSLLSNGYWGRGGGLFPGVKAAEAWSWPLTSN
jgi:hypothetical protein